MATRVGIAVGPDLLRSTPLLARFALPLALAASTVFVLAWMLAAPVAKLSPSTAVLVVMAAAVLVGLMLWPGTDPGSRLPEARLAAWSAACAGTGALAAALLVQSRLDWTRLLSTTLVAFLLLLSGIGCLTLVAAIRSRQSAGQAREIETARWTVAALLTLAAAAPLWAGPLAESTLARWPQAVETAVALSPLTHLAVAAGNDFMRNDWMYAHSSIGSLQFSYPGLPGILAAYFVLCAALLAAGRIFRVRRKHGAHDTIGPALEPARCSR